MLVLSINTVGEACEAALVESGVVLSELSEPMVQGHDARLAPIVERLMRDGGAAFAGLKRIAVVVGPGSFTGVRVGVAFARGLSLALDIPAVGVTSLEALDGLPQQGRVLGLLPAKRRPPEKTWWVQALEDGAGASEPTEAQAEALSALAARATAVCGELADVPDLGLPGLLARPRASAAAMLAARLASGALPPPRPVYVRAPDAKPMERS